MAAELRQTVGKPWDISEDSFNGAFASANSFVCASAGKPAKDESTVAPGEVLIRASVRISFQSD
jgi:hypothetical protein